MKCEKCGADIPQGKVYCSICGNEVHLVPDYNLLDEDLLGDLVNNKAVPPDEPSQSAKNKHIKKFHKSSFIIWGSICIVLVVAVSILFFAFTELQKKRENTYDYQYQKAEEYLAEGEHDQAVSCFLRALQFEPQDRAAKEQLLAIYLETEQDDAAISILQEFIAQDASDKESCKKLIAIYDRREEYDKILALCEEINGSQMLELFEDYLVEQPKFSKISGTYDGPVNIAISAQEGMDVYYTTDGSDPISDGARYYNAISLEEEGTTVLMAVAQNEKGVCSEVVKATYTIRNDPPAMPSVTPASGTYLEPQMITVKVSPNCAAYYTWDGSDPTEASSRYIGPLEMPQGNQVLSVIAVNSSGLKSAVYRVNYIYMP